MRDLAPLILHLVATLIRLARPGGVRAVVAESMTLRSHWVTVVLDQWRRRIVGLIAALGPLDGPAVCRLFEVFPYFSDSRLSPGRSG